MDPRIYKELGQADSVFESDLRRHCKQLVDMSFNFMSANYHQMWQENLNSYKAQKLEDTKDVKAGARKEPKKLIIPMTYAQVDTFVAFCYTLFTQKDNFFELVASGAEDELAKLIAQSVLERDLLESNWYGDKLQQFLKDIALFNIGVIKHTWAHEQETTIQYIVDPETGAQVPQEVPVVKFQGNKLYCINPFRFYPDPRLPITRFQDGEFVASVDEYSRHEINRMAKNGQISGNQFVTKMTEDVFQAKWLSMTFDQYNQYYEKGWTGMNPPFALTEIQVNIVPSEWKLSDGKPLGEEEYAVKYVIWLLNDQRIVFVAPLNYAHEQFTYDVGLYDFDQNTFLGVSLAEILEPIQDTATWFINSRITSVRKVIDNRFIVDPKGIELQDLKNRSPVIRVKPALSGFGVDGLIKQLVVQDVTANHLNDVQFLEGAASRSTGITENLMGLFATGRRSAAEARAVNSNASARLKKVAAGIWNNGLRLLGMKLLKNLREGMDVEQLIRIIGEVKFKENLPGVAQFMMVDRTRFDAAFDFQVFDGTLPSEKNLVAEGLGEQVGIFMQNPQMAQLLGINLTELYFEYLRMKGIRNVERFRLPQGTVTPSPAMGGTPDNTPLLQSIAGSQRKSDFGAPQSATSQLDELVGEGTDDGRVEGDADYD